MAFPTQQFHFEKTNDHVNSIDLLENLHLDSHRYRPPSQIRAEAKAEHRSLSNYLETLLYRWGYRPYNQATFEACESARAGAYAGTIDTHSDEAFVASILGDEPSKSFRVDR